MARVSLSFTEEKALPIKVEPDGERAFLHIGGYNTVDAVCGYLTVEQLTDLHQTIGAYLMSYNNAEMVKVAERMTAATEKEAA